MSIRPIKKAFIQNKEILILLLIYVIIYSFNLDKFPFVWIDENYFVNPAYNLVNFGQMGTTFMYGYYNIANFTYWQPPVFILLLATSFKLFGFGILQARMVSVSLGFLTVLFTYLITLKLYNKRIGLLASILLISNPLFFLISRQARMEIAVACFTLIALYYTFMALKNSKTVYYFASSFFATLALLSHPNGIIAIISVLLIILLDKIDLKALKLKLSVKEIYIFISGVLIPLIPYIIYISLDFQAFKSQIMTNVGGSALNPLNNIIMEPSRYIRLFWSFIGFEGRITYVVFAAALVLTILGLYYLVRKRDFSGKFLLIVLITNIGVLSVLVSHKWELYLGLVLPFWSILIALTLKYKKKPKMNKKGIISAVIIVLLAVIIIGNSIAIYTVLKNTKDYNYMEIKYEVQKYVPEGSVVVGEATYWVALHDDYTYYNRIGINATAIEELHVQYILFYDLWEMDESTGGSMGKFINQNCTLIAEIPNDKTLGFQTIKVYKVNNPS